MRSVGGSSVLTQLVVANYDLVQKADIDLERWTGQLSLDDTPSRGLRRRSSQRWRSVPRTP